MCEDCRNSLREVMAALVSNDEEHELVQMTKRMVDETLPSIMEKIRQYAAEEEISEEEIPDEERVRVNIYDTLIAAQIALCAASMASRSDAYTEEGGLPPSMILAMWAGNVMGQEVKIEQQQGLLRHLLGMGEN